MPKISKRPSTHVADGHDTRGRFAPGNKCGRGNPLAGKAAKLRTTLFQAVGTEKLRLIVNAMIEKAIEGDVAAAKLVLQYTLGDPIALDVWDEIERLRQLIKRTDSEEGKIDLNEELEL